MTVHLVNPSHLSFGVGVITPRWLFVLAGATPTSHGRPRITDETLEPLDIRTVQAGDVVGIGIHTGNALRGYEIGTLARNRGAAVVFGGIHATLYPNEAHSLGGAHAVVKGDGDVVWPLVLEDAARGTLKPVYEAGRVDADRVGGVPITRHWLIPQDQRPKVYAPHPVMSAHEIRERTQAVWDEFYSLRRIWTRSRCTPTLRARLAFVLISKLYRQMYANTGIATDSARVSRANRWARLIARPCRRLFVARPLPGLTRTAADA